MPESFKSIVCDSSDVSIEIHYEDDKREKDEKLEETFSKITTIDEIIEQFLLKLDQKQIPSDEIYLYRISHQDRRLPFPKEYLHQNLSQLKIIDGTILHFHRANWILPVEMCQLSICGPNFENQTWSWDKNSATLQMLIEYVIEVFNLKNIDRTQIHLFVRNEELDLSLHPETLVSQIGIDRYSIVSIKVIQRFTSMSPFFDDQCIVQCVYLDEHFNLKISTRNSFFDLEKKIQNHFNDSRLSIKELIDVNGQRISITDSTYSLGLLGIQSSDRIFAFLQQSNSNSNDQNENEQVNVIFSPSKYSSNHFRISINETMENLLKKIEESTNCGSSRVLKIRSEYKQIDQTKTDQRLIDLGINGKNLLHVTIAYRSTLTTWTDNPIYSITTNSNGFSSKPMGLSNIGNTCFMNSALQCLAHAKPLTTFFLNSLTITTNNSDDIQLDDNRFLTNAYADLLKLIWNKKENSFSSYFSSNSIQHIKEIIGNLAPRFLSYEQQDAQEFMTFFLEQLQKEFQQSKDSSSTKIIEELFYGKLQSIITCLKCHNEMITSNSFNLLSLPLNERERIFSIKFVGRDQSSDECVVPIKDTSLVKHLVENFKRQSTKYYRQISVLANDQIISDETSLRDIPTNELVFIEDDEWPEITSSSYFDDKSKKIRLDECLDEFFVQEGLEDLVECEEFCHERTAATKQFQVESLPPILIIQLKRFSHENGFRSKIETFVEYPIEGLDLNRFVRSTTKGEENYIYDLFAVSNHSGSIHWGHYTATARHDDQWFVFNDSFVSSADMKGDIVSPNAYVLFYMKRSEKEKRSN